MIGHKVVSNLHIQYELETATYVRENLRILLDLSYGDLLTIFGTIGVGYILVLVRSFKLKNGISLVASILLL